MADDEPLPLTDEEIEKYWHRWRSEKNLVVTDANARALFGRLLATIKADRKEIAELEAKFVSAFKTDHMISEDYNVVTRENLELRARVEELEECLENQPVPPRAWKEAQEQIAEMEERDYEWKKTLQTLVDVPACPACTKIIEDIAAGKKGWGNAKDERIAELEHDIGELDTACGDEAERIAELEHDIGELDTACGDEAATSEMLRARVKELEAEAEHLRHLIAGDYIPEELRPGSDSPWENPVKLPEKDENP